ncbi:hypothetical protein SEA_ATUIN_222 [Arthrobacter phage Atuin]|nr:hypothetical protein SEA_ATUIN_21 [Arthrobacter phage Atuin]
MVVSKEESLRDKIKETLKEHEAYTKIQFADDDNNRISFECNCGAKETDTDLLGADWLATHRTNEIVKLISASGVKL